MNRPRNFKNRSVNTVAFRALLTILTFTSAVSELNADPIPASFNKEAVQFIFAKGPGTNYSPVGTCFVVSVTTTHRIVKRFFGIPHEVYDASMSLPYLVTAKHVLSDTNGQIRPENYFVRGENSGGGISFVPLIADATNEARILTHTNKSVDLCVLAPGTVTKMATSLKSKPPGRIPYKMGSFNASLITDKAAFKKYAIREGDEMFFVGLFVPFYGSQENIPICRFGRLAMPTDERIPLGNGDSENLYLMESQVFGGNSGSPAFFYFNKNRKTGKTDFLFAGVVKGYFPDWSEVQLRDSAVKPFASQNTGIAVIVPAYELKEILFSDSEKAFRSNVWSDLLGETKK
jgi:hypothetical protein